MASHKYIIGSLVGQTIEISDHQSQDRICLVTDETKNMISVTTGNDEKRYIKKTITFRII